MPVMTDGPERSHLPGLSRVWRDNPGKSRTAGIYGAIITAAILDTAGNRLPTDALVIAVVVTLVVYWLAEQYAELLGEDVADGQLPPWSPIRAGTASPPPPLPPTFPPLPRPPPAPPTPA